MFVLKTSEFPGGVRESFSWTICRAWTVWRYFGEESVSFWWYFDTCRCQTVYDAHSIWRRLSRYVFVLFPYLVILRIISHDTLQIFSKRTRSGSRIIRICGRTLAKYIKWHLSNRSSISSTLRSVITPRTHSRATKLFRPVLKLTLTLQSTENWSKNETNVDIVKKFTSHSSTYGTIIR